MTITTLTETLSAIEALEPLGPPRECETEPEYVRAFFSNGKSIDTMPDAAGRTIVAGCSFLRLRTPDRLDKRGTREHAKIEKALLRAAKQAGRPVGTFSAFD